MKVIDKNGNVLIERQMAPVKEAKKSSLRAIRHTRSMKKAVTPVVMSKEQFFSTVIPQANGNVQ